MYPLNLAGNVQRYEEAGMQLLMFISERQSKASTRNTTFYLSIFSSRREHAHEALVIIAGGSHLSSMLPWKKCHKWVRSTCESIISLDCILEFPSHVQHTSQLRCYNRNSISTLSIGQRKTSHPWATRKWSTFWDGQVTHLKIKARWCLKNNRNASNSKIVVATPL